MLVTTLIIDHYQRAMAGLIRSWYPLVSDFRASLSAGALVSTSGRNYDPSRTS
ncbi:MAG: hypothetical protein RMY64_34555 [Nostoc sp. DedQUE08]|nr:hypothetical protein [Nostoc sp. DedQUE08]